MSSMFSRGGIFLREKNSLGGRRKRKVKLCAPEKVIEGEKTAKGRQTQKSRMN